jgi:hypothetical protein
VLGFATRSALIVMGWCNTGSVRSSVRTRLSSASCNSLTWSFLTDVEEKEQRPYRFENVTTTVHIELQMGKSKQWFSMDAVSNSPVEPVRSYPFLLFPIQKTEPLRSDQREYARWVQTCLHDKVAPFSSKDAAKIKENLAKHTTYIMTEVRSLPFPPPSRFRSRSLTLTGGPYEAPQKQTHQGVHRRPQNSP